MDTSCMLDTTLSPLSPPNSRERAPACASNRFAALDDQPEPTSEAPGPVSQFRPRPLQADAKSFTPQTECPAAITPGLRPLRADATVFTPTSRARTQALRADADAFKPRGHTAPLEPVVPEGRPSRRAILREKKRKRKRPQVAAAESPTRAPASAKRPMPPPRTPPMNVPSPKVVRHPVRVPPSISDELGEFIQRGQMSVSTKRWSEGPTNRVTTTTSSWERSSRT